VTRLSATLGVVRPEHVLAADWLHEAWEPARVAELLALFDAAGADYRIDLQTTAFKEVKEQLLEGKLPRLEGLEAGAAAAAGAAAEVFTEPWFGMEAASMRVPEKLTRSWAAGEVASDLGLPPRNPYIPSDFSLRCDEAAASDPAAAAPEGAAGEGAAGLPLVLATPPTLILDQPGELGFREGWSKSLLLEPWVCVALKTLKVYLSFLTTPNLPPNPKPPRPPPLAQAGHPLPPAPRPLLLPPRQPRRLQLAARRRADGAVAQAGGGRPERGRLPGRRGGCV
jgi:hypothetical protein